MTGNTLFRKLQQKRFSPRHVAEVGVYLPETSNLYDFILSGVRSTLVEPDPVSAEAIKRHFAGKANVALHTVAVYDKRGTLQLVKRGPSTYAATIVGSPAAVNDQYRLRDADRFYVEAVTFDEIDDGTIDLLSVDIEGGEWYVIKHMKSRPAVISLETHAGLYRNPYMDQIKAWMRSNGYQLWYIDDSDSIYTRADVFRITPTEKARLLLAKSAVALERASKYIKRKLRRRQVKAE